MKAAFFTLLACATMTSSTLATPKTGVICRKNPSANPYEYEDNGFFNLTPKERENVDVLTSSNTRREPLKCGGCCFFLSMFCQACCWGPKQLFNHR